MPWGIISRGTAARERRQETLKRGSRTHARTRRGGAREAGAYGALTGNGDEQEEYPRIHELAGRQEAAAAAAGWRGGSPGHHAPRRIADLDTWGYNSGSLHLLLLLVLLLLSLLLPLLLAPLSRRRTNAPTDLRRRARGARTTARNSANRLLLAFSHTCVP